MLKKAWNAIRTSFLGGTVETTLGSVRGEPAMGTTADLLKSTGELRVHVVRDAATVPLVTLELMQAQVPGDGDELACVRLSPAEAVRLGTLLKQAAQSANAPTE